MPPGPLNVPPERAIAALQKQLDKAASLDIEQYAIKRWSENTSSFIDMLFGSEDRRSKEFRQMDWSAPSWREDLTRRTEKLHNFIEMLELELPVPPIPVTATLANPQPSLSNKIFIVHGHGGELKEATARLVSQIKLEPVILHEQPNQGRTIIEKFSAFAKEAGFAIVLLTADDVGAAGKVERHSDLQPRARQNVIFELGFFFGALTRGRVCAVYERGVEIPSDLGGVLYIPYDVEGQWKVRVAKEIKAAGYPVDLNLV
jgi:hypothetical protein